MATIIGTAELQRKLDEVIVTSGVATSRALEAVARAIETDAKRNVSNGAHARGTPTPARPGEGPAVISGDLRRSITHTRVVRVGDHLETRVGPASIPHRDSNATSGRIGEWLETGLKNGATYPFLLKAYRSGVAQAPILFAQTYAEWERSLRGG